MSANLKAGLITPSSYKEKFTLLLKHMLLGLHHFAKHTLSMSIHTTLVEGHWDHGEHLLMLLNLRFKTWTNLGRNCWWLV